MPAASAPVAPWPSSAAASTPTSSGWWAAGAPTPCFATCTPKPFPSFETSAELCSPMAPTPFSRALTSRSPLHSSSRRLRHHSTANYPPTHPPMAGMAQEQGGGGPTTSKVGFGHTHPPPLSIITCTVRAAGRLAT